MMALDVGGRRAPEATVPRLSVVVICFNMRREIARTLHSLSAAYQQGVAVDDYEVILVDNGSSEPPTEAEFSHLGLNLRVLRNSRPTPSPVDALNLGIAESKGDLIGVMIDGARMASPGLLAACSHAARLHHRPIVFTESFSLGHGWQWMIAQEGYDSAEEDRLLASIDWPNDGYRLFEIATGLSPDAPNFQGHYESNALFMPRDLWAQTGGYDPGFQTPGGGCASMDLLQRALTLPDVQMIVVEGEATFHQIHDGSASTSAKDAANRLKLFSREYHRLRNKPMRPVDTHYWTFRLSPRKPAARVPTPQGGTRVSVTGEISERYLKLLGQVLLNEHGLPWEAEWLALHEKLAESSNPPIEWPTKDDHALALRRLERGRAVGADRRALPFVYTMVGRRRLDNVAQCVSSVLDDGIRGDLIECGVWRGGVCIFMNGMLRARGVTDRLIWVADSFEGLPPPHPDTDEGVDISKDKAPQLVAGLDLVRSNFKRFELLDDRVRFLKGWFKDTLPTAPIEQIAVLRMDGDLYSSTMDILTNLYSKVAVGGYVIVDDYKAFPQCRRAVDIFRAEYGSVEKLHRIDWTGVYWRKEAPAV